jgi:lipopolysaccharide cholinephosphotransferase
MAGKHTLEGKNGIIALKMLKDVTDLLDEYGIEYWLEGGTLLGVIRENRLLPWDNDMDISIKEEYYDKLMQIVKSLNYRVRFKEFEKDDAPFKKGVKRLVKVRNSKFLFFRGEVALDIFIKFEKDNEYFWQVGKKKKSVESFYYKELIKHTFNGKDYLIPKLYEEYLTSRYGDWKTAVKEWDTFKDDQAIKGNI